VIKIKISSERHSKVQTDDAAAEPATKITRTTLH